MPIYEYACAACGHEFEEWQKITDGPIKVCPKCKKRKVERLISRSSFQLKGGGWYSDLYSTSKPGAKPDAGEAAATKPEKTDAKSADKGGGSDAAPAAKAESQGGGDKPAARSSESKSSDNKSSDKKPAAAKKK